jgi:hypothetical protein
LNQSKANTKPALIQKCNDLGITHPKAEKTNRNELAGLLAGHFQREALAREAAVQQRLNISDDNVDTNRHAQIAFLQRMVPHWFMRP